MRIICLFFIFSPFFCVLGQQSFQLGFYNVENLFDTINAPVKMDGEFTPSGAKYYNTEKYWLKINRIARVIAAINDWEGVDALGLAEIENAEVVEDLLDQTALKEFGYKYVHYESTDERGIDVVFIYKEELFDLDTSVQIKVEMFDERPTRDILHVRLSRDTATYDVFINHWPSRYGGVLETEEKRKRAALVLQNYLIQQQVKHPIVMGDFNDPITGRAIEWLEKVSKIKSLELYSGRQIGTLKYRSHWYNYDQILVGEKLEQYVEEAKIFCPDWLLEEDELYEGIAPKRFFRGDKFNDGYSDHLPIYIRLRLQ